MTRRHTKSRSSNEGARTSQRSSSEVAALARQRARDAVVWGTPIVSFDAMREAYFRDAGAQYNDVVYFSRPADWNFQIATPNASSHYVFIFFNTSDGPLVLDIPPAEGAGLFGSVLDAWQVPYADIGPHGEDRGDGGSYLLLPPGQHTTDVPPDAIVVPLQTYNGYIALRAIREGSDEEATERALALVQKLRIYPANGSGSQRQRFIDISGEFFDGIVPFDDDFFDSLARMIEEEPVLARDSDEMDQLEMLGIVKGATFRPDPATRAMLGEAARAVHEAYMSAAQRNGSVFWQGRHWRWPNPVGVKTGFTFLTERGLDVNARGLVYYLGCAPPASLGRASAYLSAFVDARGEPLAGERMYRLHIPAHVPAAQFWAATVYDASTAAFVRESPRVEINSYAEELELNADGSIDLYFGPEPPAGLEANWAYTDPGEPWFMMFRLYGPTDGLFDDSWQLPDLMEIEIEVAERVEVEFDVEGVVVEPRVRSGVPDHHGWLATELAPSRVGELELVGGFPTAYTADKLYEQQLFHRAVEVFLAQLPAVSIACVMRGIVGAGADAANKLLVFDTLMDSRTLLLTGNTETVYAMAALDLNRDGPTVVEVPPNLLGGSNDAWQRNLMDVGASGPDRGRGGRYLFLPPDHEGPVPDGYFTVPSSTYGVFFGVRGFLVDGKPDRAAALVRTLKIYPLSAAASPPAMVYIGASGKPIDTIFPDTYEFFELLADVVEREPIDAVPASDRFLLAAIGIDKAKRFEPDDKTRVVLGEAARVGGAMARANLYASRDVAAVVYPDRRWEWAFIGGSVTFDSDGYVNSDRRAAAYYAAIGSSPAMVTKIVGGGSQYLWTPRDVHGDYLDGGRHYRLHLPPNIPAEKFWSVVGYDAISRSELQTGQRLPSVSQYTGPAANSDGSYDIYFGPTAPPGKERNWIQTVPGKGWFPYLRIYSPSQAFFDQTWRPDDVVPEDQ